MTLDDPTGDANTTGNLKLRLISLGCQLGRPLGLRYGGGRYLSSGAGDPRLWTVIHHADDLPVGVMALAPSNRGGRVAILVRVRGVC